MTLRVGLTGGIGSGKSTVASLFESRGVQLIDTDAISHSLTASNGAAMPRISETFGPEVKNADGSLNRTVMRQRVFSDAKAKKKLEGILHPMIQRRVDEQISAYVGEYVILAIPLLIETGNYQNRIDRVLVVDCPEEIQITRTIARSHLQRQEVEAIMAAQCPRQQRLQQADDIILNGGDVAPLTLAVDVLHQRYLRLAAISNQHR
jgi:dephospho-CoA kinase